MTSAPAVPGVRQAWSVTTETIRSLDAARALVPEWEELAEQCGAGPFARPTYSLSWWEHLGEGRLLLVVVRDGGRLVALAPLHERRMGPIWLARWLGHGLGTIAEALVLPGDDAATTERRAAELWAAVAAPRRVLQLLECHSGSRALPALEAAPGRRTRVSERDLCPVVDLGDDRRPFLEGPERRRLRRTLSVATRRLEEAGLRHRVEVLTDLAGFEAVLPDITTVFDAAEEENSRQHLLREPWGDFTRGYLRAALPAGEAMVFVGYVDDQPVSFDLSLVADNVVHSWITRFDPAFASHSPGHLLKAAIMERAVADGRRRVDLLLGDGVHKQLWATGSYATLEVMSGSPAALAAASGVLGAAADLKRRLS